MPGSGWPLSIFHQAATNSLRELQTQHVAGKSVTERFVGGRAPCTRRTGLIWHMANLSDQGTYKLFYLTGCYDPQGHNVTFSYTSGFAVLRYLRR